MEVVPPLREDILRDVEVYHTYLYYGDISMPMKNDLKTLNFLRAAISNIDIHNPPKMIYFYFNPFTQGLEPYTFLEISARNGTIL